MSEAAPPRAAGRATAWYLYGVVPAGAASPAEGLEGVDSRTVELLGEGAVAALVSRVPTDVFGEEPLRANLEDSTWLERTALAHEGVLEAALSGSAVVPFRLGTLYAEEDRLRRFLGDGGAGLARLLRALDGKVELGVKAYLDRGRFADAAARERGAAASDAEPGSGRAYLLQRRLERELAEEAERFRVSCARASHERLAEAAHAATANPPQPQELSGRSEQMLLNGAYLVERDGARLRQAAAELAEAYGDRGVSYEVTGPWPPYNFVPRELA